MQSPENKFKQIVRMQGDSYRVSWKTKTQSQEFFGPNNLF